MFPLSTRTRRLLCRIAFGVLCVAPTIGVSGWAIAVNLPGRADAFSRRLTDETGLIAAVDGVSTPRPGVTVYVGLSLSDPETGDVVFRASRLEATNQGSNWTVTAVRPCIDLYAVETLVDWLDRRLLLESHGAARWSFAADEVLVAAGESKSSLTWFRGQVAKTPDESEATARFGLAGIELKRPIQAWLGRRRMGARPQTWFAFDARSGPVPCSLFEPLEALAAVGREARFQGFVQATLENGQWRGDLSGEVGRIELARFCEGRLPYRVSGMANAKLDQVLFAGGRIVEADGTIESGPGRIDRSLVRSAVESLELSHHERLAGLPASIPFERLAFGFSLNADGITLSGKTAERGVTLVDAEGPLLGEPKSQPQPVARLVRALVSQYSVEVPATAEASEILAVMPLASGISQDRTARREELD